MKICEIVSAVQDSKEFKNFISAHPDNYLVHLFTTLDASKSEDWQVGYYSKATDKIIIFDYNGTDITVIPPQEAFKEKNYIEKLLIDKVVIEKDPAMSTVQDVMKDNYSFEQLVRAIVLLQNLPEFGQIWNVTIITLNFTVINVKIDAQTGKVIKHSKESLIGWNKK